MSVAPLAEFDPAIHVLAVYGSLRDDDDSGQAWTTEFISGLGGARDGVVEGATIYWDLDAGYPKVILDRARNDTEADAAASTDSEAATSSPAAPTTPDFVHVRLLSWPSRAAFEAKMRAADLIEGFNPADESGSEYVRRAVWVRCVDPQTGKVERIRSWIYVMVETMTPHEKWVRIPAQDWMKRDRALKR
jgi:gamma-glutamylcyclotransferase (GGCT)/AIG2-like uncharacterized protein YtfP